MIPQRNLLGCKKALHSSQITANPTGRLSKEEEEEEKSGRKRTIQYDYNLM